MNDGGGVVVVWRGVSLLPPTKSWWIVFLLYHWYLPTIAVFTRTPQTFYVCIVMFNTADYPQASSCYNFTTAINVHALTFLSLFYSKLIIHYREAANPSALETFPCWDTLTSRVTLLLSVTKPWHCRLLTTTPNKQNDSQSCCWKTNQHLLTNRNQAFSSTVVQDMSAKAHGL